jgi:predicted HicB family RNase H-like nuclease
MSTATSHRSQVTVRLDPDLLARISAAAASDRRPVSQYVRNLILDAVDGDRDRQVEHAGGRRHGY